MRPGSGESRSAYRLGQARQCDSPDLAPGAEEFLRASRHTHWSPRNKPTNRELAPVAALDQPARTLRAPHGLTWPREECEKEPLYPFPCYVARGRFDPGVYLSVERSDAYATFTPGLFIVIAASGEPGSPELTSTLTKVRKAHPDAYVKQERVYHGCMH